MLLLQRGLRRSVTRCPVTGVFDGLTARAVLAFRKANGWVAPATPSSAVFGKLLPRRGPRSSCATRSAGRHVEFDWSRQVLVLADSGRACRTYHASSGKPSTPTVFGTFRFYRKTPGTNAKGMVHSTYFIRGYAIHGYASVPTYPASHGCIRVPIPNARDDLQLDQPRRHDLRVPLERAQAAIRAGDAAALRRLLDADPGLVHAEVGAGGSLLGEAVRDLLRSLGSRPAVWQRLKAPQRESRALSDAAFAVPPWSAGPPGRRPS